MSQRLSIQKKRTWKTFQKDRLENMSDSIIGQTILAKTRFDEFLYSEYDGLDTEKFITHIKSINEDERDDELFSILQAWIDWLSNTFNLNSASTRQAFSRLNKFLRYCRVKITPNDIKDEIVWPEVIQEERYAASEDEFIQIVSGLSWRNKGFCIGLSCPGLRPMELMGTQKKHYKFVNGRWMIEIPYYLTKKRISRTAGFTKEFNPFISKLLKERENDDFVWTKQKQIPQKVFDKYSHLKKDKARIKAIKKFAGDMLVTVRRSFNVVLEKLELDMRYESTREHKITLYSLRARFITRALKVLDGDTVHAIVGHGAYLQTYQRRTIEEKAELIDEVESEVMILDQSKNTQKIKRLTEDNKKLEIKDYRLTKVEDMLVEIVEKNILESTLENQKLVSKLMEHAKTVLNNF